MTDHRQNHGEVPTTSNRTYVDWEAERRADRIAGPWIRGSQAAWEASRPAGWIRWCDVVPVTCADQFSARSRERRKAEARRIESRYQTQAREAAQEQSDEAWLAYRREVSRRSYERKRLRLYGTKTKEELAAEREERRRETRTPEQQARHDEYMARREQVLARARERYQAKKEARS